MLSQYIHKILSIACKFDNEANLIWKVNVKSNNVVYIKSLIWKTIVKVYIDSLENSIESS